MKEFTFFLKLEFQKLEFFQKYTSNFHNFSMVLEFFELKYHGKLNFAKFENPKISKSLHISEIIVDCNIVCRNMLFDSFHPIT